MRVGHSERKSRDRRNGGKDGDLSSSSQLGKRENEVGKIKPYYHRSHHPIKLIVVSGDLRGERIM